MIFQFLDYKHHDYDQTQSVCILGGLIYSKTNQHCNEGDPHYVLYM